MAGGNSSLQRPLWYFMGVTGLPLLTAHREILSFLDGRTRWSGDGERRPAAPRCSAWRVPGPRGLPATSRPNHGAQRTRGCIGAGRFCNLRGRTMFRIQGLSMRLTRFAVIPSEGVQSGVAALYSGNQEVAPTCHRIGGGGSTRAERDVGHVVVAEVVEAVPPMRRIVGNRVCRCSVRQVGVAQVSVTACWGISEGVGSRVPSRGKLGGVPC